MKKAIWVSILLLFSMNCSIASALDKEVKNIEDMITVPANFQQMEQLLREEPSDTPKIKALRRDLKEAMEKYYATVRELEAKYRPWIKTEHKSQELRDRIEAIQDSEIAEIVSSYVQLGISSLEGYLQAPRGTKGVMGEMIAEQKLKSQEMIVSQKAEQLGFAKHENAAGIAR